MRSLTPGSPARRVLAVLNCSCSAVTANGVNGSTPYQARRGELGDGDDVFEPDPQLALDVDSWPLRLTRPRELHRPRRRREPRLPRRGPQQAVGHDDPAHGGDPGGGVRFLAFRRLGRMVVKAKTKSRPRGRSSTSRSDRLTLPKTARPRPALTKPRSICTSPETSRPPTPASKLCRTPPRQALAEHCRQMIAEPPPHDGDGIVVSAVK